MQLDSILCGHVDILKLHVEAPGRVKWGRVLSWGLERHAWDSRVVKELVLIDVKTVEEPAAQCCDGPHEGRNTLHDSKDRADDLTHVKRHPPRFHLR